jgi:hypothetical protein
MTTVRQHGSGAVEHYDLARLAKASTWMDELICHI